MYSNSEQIDAYLNGLINFERSSVMSPKTGPPDFRWMHRAIKAAGLWKAPPITILIAGTKGKGSTLLYLEALLSPVRRVVSFTSPHLLSVRERIRVTGKPIEESIWIDGFNKLFPALEKIKSLHEPLTFFETLFLHFLWTLFHLEADVALVEVGLGGTYDCTNILTPTVSVLTPIDYDHTEILGNDLLRIARDKAGIIKPGRPVVVGRQRPTVQREISRSARENQSTVMSFGKDFRWTGKTGNRWDYWQEGSIRYKDLQLSALGKHQRDNATTALRVLTMFEKVGLHFSVSDIRKRLSRAHPPARLELLQGSPPVLLDVAHNPASFRALATLLREKYCSKKILLVMGMVEPKDYRACLRVVQPHVSEAIFTKLSHPRTREPEDLAAFALSEGIKAEIVMNEKDAFARAHLRTDIDLIVIAGSFILAGVYLSWRQSLHGEV